MAGRAGMPSGTDPGVLRCVLSVVESAGEHESRKVSRREARREETTTCTVTSRNVARTPFAGSPSITLSICFLLHDLHLRECHDARKGKKLESETLFQISSFFSLLPLLIIFISIISAILPTPLSTSPKAIIL